MGVGGHSVQKANRPVQIKDCEGQPLILLRVRVAVAEAGSDKVVEKAAGRQRNAAQSADLPSGCCRALSQQQLPIVAASDAVFPEIYPESPRRDSGYSLATVGYRRGEFRSVVGQVPGARKHFPLCTAPAEAASALLPPAVGRRSRAGGGGEAGAAFHPDVLLPRDPGLL